MFSAPVQSFAVLSGPLKAEFNVARFALSALSRNRVGLGDFTSNAVMLEGTQEDRRGSWSLKHKRTWKTHVPLFGSVSKSQDGSPSVHTSRRFGMPARFSGGT